MTQKKLSKNTSGLKEFAEKKNQETIAKVNKAIDRLKRSKTKAINFKTVAEEAGVSKATLYNNDVLKERISGLRAVSKDIADGGIVAPPKDKIQTFEDKLKRLYEEVKGLKEDKRKLVVQLVEMEELKDENIRLKEQIIRLKK